MTILAAVRRSTRRALMLGGVLALFCATDAAAQLGGGVGGVKLNKRPKLAAKGPDLRLNRVMVENLKGGKAALRIFLGQSGRQRIQGDVQVFFVKGSQRTLLHKGKSRFTNSRDGFAYATSVTLPRNASQGRLEVVVGDPKTDPKASDNRKTIILKGRTDLAFDGRPKVVRKAGARPNREYIVKVKNIGMANSSAGCSVAFKITETGRARNVKKSLPALRPGASTEVKVSYQYQRSSNMQHNQIEARIKCAQDLGESNNQHRGRLE